MRTTLARALLGALLVCAAGCGSDGSSTGYDAVQTVDGRGTANTLVMMLAVRVGPTNDPALSTHQGRYVDFRQIRSVELLVDGRDWGRYEADREAGDPATGEPVGSWSLHDEPSSAVVVAGLGTELERTRDDLDTIGEWAELLDRHLVTGGHVAEIALVELETNDGAMLDVTSRLLFPFTILEGDRSAFVGEIEVPFDAFPGVP
jgi:hypothetical protein